MQAFQELTEEEAKESDPPDSAVATLRAEMLFYRDQAAVLCDKIMELLKSQNANGTTMAMMYKYATESKKMAIDCAAKLAPYESARLQAVEVTEKKIIKFVIESPSRIDNPDAWLENTKKEMKLIHQMKNNAEEAEVIPNGN